MIRFLNLIELKKAFAPGNTERKPFYFKEQPKVGQDLPKL